MRFKTIILIFVLAMFMFAGVAWAGNDDDQGENDDWPFTNIDPDCPILAVIDAPSSTYDTIAEHFYECGCEIVYNEKIEIKICTSDGNCNDDEKDSILGRIASSFAATVPSTAIVCGASTPEDITFPNPAAVKIIIKRIVPQNKAE